jgi:hypothetical protein
MECDEPQGNMEHSLGMIKSTQGCRREGWAALELKFTNVTTSSYFDAMSVLL